MSSFWKGRCKWPWVDDFLISRSTFLATGRQGCASLLQNWLSAWAFFGFTWFLCGCSPAPPVQIYYSVSNATWKRRKTSLKGNGNAKGSNEQPVLWTHELHSFSKDLVTAHLSTENLISTIYTLSPHPFSHRFKQSRSCWYLYWSQCQRTKHSYEQFSETLWLDKIQWSSYHGLSCNVAHLFQFLISTEGKNIISMS